MEHTPVATTPNTQTARVLTLAREKGILRAGDLAAAGIPRVVLTRLTGIGQLERLGRVCIVCPKPKLPNTKASPP